MNSASAMHELRCSQPGEVPAGLLTADEPCVVRGLLAHWPLVQAAHQGAAAAAAVLRSHWRDATVGVFEMAADTGGRITYNAEFSGFNFERRLMPFGAVLDQLLALQQAPAPSFLYMGSTSVDSCLPGFSSSHPLQLETLEPPLASLWLGNQITVPAHQDWPSNLACCVSGRRRFTVFPPDAVGDLYIGPLDLTPAGQPVSLVDPLAPDWQQHFPRYARALERAQVVELAPGDALYLPSLWWHRVEALEPFSGLINYWWRKSPEWSDSPNTALWLALATVRDLPPAERAAWRALFDHYVFDADAHTAAHIPEAARGLLAPFTEAGMRRMRAWLLKKLNR
ncbi:cupin-like domain-containing protein [Paucibacter sp. APW11]|uniref:Cupin-like domain-containing protein n=1 Tax=Roseateles aquae TaxID=3077235 RepID=A0ABU3PGS9_9BURK|nr:cupin-like domain-containing protein [Paucibacter sp. APW11]MDT9001557.1 cupin-like domain-containing protein [Paucibacter sp. APW11]